MAAIASNPRFRITRSAIVMIKNEPYKLLEETIAERFLLIHMKTGQPYVCADATGEMGLLTQDGWDDHVLAGDLKVVEPPSKLTSRMLARMTHWDSHDIVGRADGTRKEGEELPLEPEAAKMLAEVLLMDENGVPNGVKAMEKAFAKLWKGELLERFGPHDNVKTIKRWRSERGTPGNRLLVDFIRMWGRVPRGIYFDGVVNEVIQLHCLRARLEPGTVEEIRAQICTVLDEISAGLHKIYPRPEDPYGHPSYSKVYRAWRDLENAHTITAREGELITRSEWRGSGRPLVAHRPFELGIMDHTRLDMVVVFDVENDLLSSEVWLTILIDVYSRVVLGWVITAFPPSLWTVSECIRRANLPKRPPADMAKRYPILKRLCGKTIELVVDNGREFRGHGLEDAAANAGFGVRFAPIKKPTYKAIGERAFGTIQGFLTRRLPGKTIPIARARKAEYDPKLQACVTMDDLEALANQGFAEYHTDTHDGLIGRQPALMFHKGTGGYIDAINDLEGFAREVMSVVLDAQIDKAGVSQWGLRFFDPVEVPNLLDDLVPIEPMRQRRDDATATGKFKYDPMNIGQIYFWNRKTKRYVMLRCEHSNYADGMPLKLHEDIMEQAKQEAAEFNTEAERMTARTRRIDAIRAIDITSSDEAKKELQRLLEIPRIHQITGNIVDLTLERPTPVTVGDFISHDMASIRSIDDEIRSPRKPIAEEGGNRRKRVPARDRRGSVEPRKTVGDRKPADTTRAARPVKPTKRSATKN